MSHALSKKLLFLQHTHAHTHTHTRTHTHSHSLTLVCVPIRQPSAAPAAIVEPEVEDPLPDMPEESCADGGNNKSVDGSGAPLPGTPRNTSSPSQQGSIRMNLVSLVLYRRCKCTRSMPSHTYAHSIACPVIQSRSHSHSRSRSHTHTHTHTHTHGTSFWAALDSIVTYLCTDRPRTHLLLVFLPFIVAF